MKFSKRKNRDKLISSGCENEVELARLSAELKEKREKVEYLKKKKELERELASLNNELESVEATNDDNIEEEVIIMSLPQSSSSLSSAAVALASSITSVSTCFVPRDCVILR